MISNNENVTIISQNHNNLMFHRKAIFLESQLCVITSHLKRTKKMFRSLLLHRCSDEMFTGSKCRRILLVSRLCSIWVHFKYEE